MQQQNRKNPQERNSYAVSIVDWKTVKIFTASCNEGDFTYLRQSNQTDERGSYVYFETAIQGFQMRIAKNKLENFTQSEGWFRIRKSDNHLFADYVANIAGNPDDIHVDHLYSWIFSFSATSLLRWT